MTGLTDRPPDFPGVASASPHEMHTHGSSHAIDHAADDDVHSAEPPQFIMIPISGRSLRDIEREVLLVTMRLTAFNYSAAARILGISRPTLYRKLQENGISRRPAP